MQKLFLIILLTGSITGCVRYVGTEDFCNIYKPIPKFKGDLIATADREKFKENNFIFFDTIDENNDIQKRLCFKEYGYSLPK